MVPQTQDSLDQWVGLLGATGGAINPSKSLWYLLDYKWRGSSWIYRPQRDMPGSLSAVDPDGVVTQLLRLDPHQASKQLGVYIACDGNMQEEIKFLTSKGDKWTQNLVCNCILDKNEVWRNYTHTISKTFQYAMSATTITEKEWDKIVSKPKQASLSRSGVVRTLKHDI